MAAGLEAGEDPVRVVTGNPASRRDFTDVRDVAEAYRLLAAAGEPGVFNVCSGRRSPPASWSRRWATWPAWPIDHVVDQGRVRAHDVPEVRGSFARLARATGWEPRIPLRADAGRHRGLVARGDPRRPGGPRSGGLSARSASRLAPGRPE